MAGQTEPILWEFRRAIAPLFVPLDLGIYRTGAMLENLPWRAVGVGVVVGTALFFGGKLLLPNPDAGLLVSGAFAVLALLMGVELINRRDVLTRTHLIQQRGILGRKQLRISLESIVRVEYHYPRWGEPWNVGDVFIKTEGRDLRLTAVCDAALGAQAILDAKGRRQVGAA
jgi:hypothetical protein